MFGLREREIKKADMAAAVGLFSPKDKLNVQKYDYTVLCTFGPELFFFCFGDGATALLV